MAPPDLRRNLALSTGDSLPPEFEEKLEQHLLERTRDSLPSASLVVGAAMGTSILVRHGIMVDASLPITLSNLALGLVGLAVYLASRGGLAPERARPLASLLVLGTVLECGWVIHLGGGLASPSWPSLMLVLLGVPLLFPLTVREVLPIATAVWLLFLALVQSVPTPSGLVADRILWLTLSTLVSLAAARVTSRLLRSRFRSRLALQEEQARTEQLLLNVLPTPIADRLKAGEESIADAFEEVSVLFADIVGFTPLSASRSAGEVVDLLDELFTRFDALAEARDLEKIKTIGDCYMVAGGIPTPRENHLQQVATLALEMQAGLEVFAREHQVDLQMRIGVHLGPVIAGVIGRSKFVYDLWGDTVNLASRLESHGIPGRVQVSRQVRERLGEAFPCEPRGEIAIKGKGVLETWLLLPEESPPEPRESSRS